MSILGDLAASLKPSATPSRTRTYTAADVNKPKSSIDDVLSIMAPGQATANAQPGDPGFDWSQYHTWKARQVDPVGNAKILAEKFNQEDRLKGDQVAAAEQARLQEIAGHPGREAGNEIVQSIISGRLPIEVGLSMLTAGTAGPAASTAGKIGRAVMSAPATVALEAASYLPGNVGRGANALRTLQSFMGLGGLEKNAVKAGSRALTGAAERTLPKEILTGAEAFGDVAKRTGRTGLHRAEAEIPYRMGGSVQAAERAAVPSVPQTPLTPQNFNAREVLGKERTTGSFKPGTQELMNPITLSPEQKLGYKVADMERKLSPSMKESFSAEGVPDLPARAGGMLPQGPTPETRSLFTSVRDFMRKNPKPSGVTPASMAAPVEVLSTPAVTEPTLSAFPPKPGMPGFGRQRVASNVKFMSQEPLMNLVNALQAETGRTGKITALKKTPRPTGSSPLERAIRQRGHAFGEF